MLLVIARKEKISPSDSNNMDGMDTSASTKDEEKENSQVKGNKE
jgi:hypothetical protein